MERSFTLIETITAVIIAGIISVAGFVTYRNVVEKSVGTEAFGILYQVKMKYELLKTEHPALLVGYNPNIGEESNNSWGLMNMVNPNSNSNNYFSYDVWVGCTPTNPCTYNPNFTITKDIVIAVRKKDKQPYSFNVDYNRYEYMYLDTGQLVKSSPY